MAGLAVRLLSDPADGGAANMAADEVLLESAIRGVASLRFYEWRPATVSLGYFQAASARLAEPGLTTLPLVRRPSGGATLVHDRELTYALALPAGGPWQHEGLSSRGWLERMHAVIWRALAGLGVKAETVRSDVRAPGPLCFQHLTPGDLVFAGHKVVGSAQRRQRAALLQHGAVILSRSGACTVLPGIEDLSGVRLVNEELRRAVTVEFAAETGWAVEPGAWEAEEMVRRGELEREKYSRDSWNLRR